MTPASISSYNVLKEQIPGWTRGWDVRTGKLKWTFHTVPRPGEFGNDTWESDSWSYTGKVSGWTIFSADEELGYLYAAAEHRGARLLRRSSPGRRPVRRVAALSRRRDRQTHLAPAVRAPRPVGLRPPRRAQSARRDGRTDGTDQGGRAGHEAGLPVRVRSRDRRTDLADRGAARSSVRRARRARLADAAVPDQAGPVRVPGRRRSTISSTSRPRSGRWPSRR